MNRRRIEMNLHSLVAAAVEKKGKGGGGGGFFIEREKNGRVLFVRKYTTHHAGNKVEMLILLDAY